jgi:hypothetical protein
MNNLKVLGFQIGTVGSGPIDRRQETSRPRNKPLESQATTKEELLEVLRQTYTSLHFTFDAIEKVAQADPGNIQQVAAAQFYINDVYYQGMLAQTQKAFRSSMIGAGIGLAFFITSIVFALFVNDQSLWKICLAEGIAISGITSMSLWIYNRSMRQLSYYRTRLEQTQRYILANSVCENLEGETKQRTRAELALMIASPLEFSARRTGHRYHKP